jgi:hypothetical protein
MEEKDGEIGRKRRNEAGQEGRGGTGRAGKDRRSGKGNRLYSIYLHIYVHYINGKEELGGEEGPGRDRRNRNKGCCVYI